MRNSLPKKVKQNECGIVNLDSTKGFGTHWVCFAKNRHHIEYFDSFGNLQPPLELLKYLGNNVSYNYTRKQKFNTFNCGHLCLQFLSNFKFE